MNMYISSIDDNIYEMVYDFEQVTKDWNCDRDIYTLEVYYQDIRAACSSYIYQFKTMEEEGDKT